MRTNRFKSISSCAAFNSMLTFWTVGENTVWRGKYRLALHNKPIARPMVWWQLSMLVILLLHMPK